MWVSSVGEVYCTKRREAVRYVTKLGVGEISMYLLFIYLITVTNSKNLSPAYKHTQRSISALQLSQNLSPAYKHTQRSARVCRLCHGSGCTQHIPLSDLVTNKETHSDTQVSLSVSVSGSDSSQHTPVPATWRPEPVPLPP